MNHSLNNQGMTKSARDYISHQMINNLKWRNILNGTRKCLRWVSVAPVNPWTLLFLRHPVSVTFENREWVIASEAEEVILEGILFWKRRARVVKSNQGTALWWKKPLICLRIPVERGSKKERRNGERKKRPSQVADVSTFILQDAESAESNYHLVDYLIVHKRLATGTSLNSSLEFMPVNYAPPSISLL